MSINTEPEAPKDIETVSIRALTLPNIIGLLVATFAFIVTWKILL